MTDIPQLKPIEISTLQLVASGLSNEEIAAAQSVELETLKKRVSRLHRLIGTSTTTSDGPMSRIRMVIWAYEHGLVVAAAQPAKLSDPLVEQLLDYAEAAYNDQPRGGLRELATVALQTAGRLPRPNQRRAKPALPV